MCNDARAAMTRTDDVHHVQVIQPDEPVEMRVDEVQSGRCAPMPQETRLDVFFREGAFKQRILFEVDLPNGKVVRGVPVFVKLSSFFPADWLRHSDS